MKNVLLLFQVITGLSINFSKSVIYHAYDDKSTRTGMKILGCQEGQLPFKYLGDWIGVEKKASLKWNSMVDQVKVKLKGWKCNNLNMAGRMVLIRSSLDSIPIYWFSLHKIPKKIIKRIDGIRRNFFFGRNYRGSRNEEKNAYSSM